MGSAIAIPCSPDRKLGRRPLFLVGLLLVLITGCATRPYQGADVSAAAFLQRAKIQQQGDLTVSAALPDPAETEALTGLDLYAQGIQPVWLKIENNSSSNARLATWSVDRNYFSPIEVAYMNRKKFSSEGYTEMERWFYDNGMQRRIPSGESRSGLVFTNLRPGNKGVNIDVFSNKKASSFTFFLPLPGFTADYSRVNFDSLYTPDEIQQVDQEGLRLAIEQDMPCCVTDETGELNGGPINMVLVASRLALRRSLLRGGWLETTVGTSMTEVARKHHFEGREPDAIFYVERPDGTESLQMNLWLAPWQVGNRAVWVAQAFYQRKDSPLAISLRNSGAAERGTLLSRFVGESIAADIDSAQRFAAQNFWYNQSLLKLGLVDGAGVSTVEDPATTFDGFGYFTTGKRAVLFLSETPVAVSDTRIIYGELSGGAGND